MSGGAMQLHLSSRGALAHLRPRKQPPLVGSLAPNAAELRVRAVGLNFRDVLNVLGEYPGNPGPPGADTAATVVAAAGGEAPDVGSAVVGVCMTGPLASVAIGEELLFTMKPDGVTFEQASTLPVTYAIHFEF